MNTRKYFGLNCTFFNELIFQKDFSRNFLPIISFFLSISLSSRLRSIYTFAQFPQNMFGRMRKRKIEGENWDRRRVDEGGVRAEYGFHGNEANGAEYASISLTQCRIIQVFLNFKVNFSKK